MAYGLKTLFPDFQTGDLVPGILLPLVVSQLGQFLSCEL